ncbi:MAG TPA: RNA polymerase subunit sigma-70 [Cryomorphaceae bacterium]|nr:RNA polymerase subunit sigma-70 [Owenweeksia sp.]MBF99049.1 RNA polymerase subunit sigma-70 [Owenweeksia sp.]HAD98606.1 RNA polymerase subunit sigma-70 [Cryomorphaceae bacterium]HBF19737.1 RNA polymerase subunit sigma-70 [Cryomorphaceae bacterium]|tara:strand:- start:542 stop:991 length:450 start_codon:yes stop_codon:yes gene_type:complete
MLMVCRRYLFNKQQADATLNKGFLKVFRKLHTFRNQGSFEGWVRKIMVRECLDENKAKRVAELPIEEQESLFLQQVPEVEKAHNVRQIMLVIEALPHGYREVFNLYEIEGYDHGEIAKQMEITESASRSQLARAKQLLRKKLKDIEGLE